MFPTVNSAGSIDAAPEALRAIVAAPPQRFDHVAPPAPGENRPPADDLLLDATSDRRRRQEHVHAGSELHQAHAVAARLLRPSDAADDTPRQHADDLPEHDSRR